MVVLHRLCAVFLCFASAPLPSTAEGEAPGSEFSGAIEALLGEDSNRATQEQTISLLQRTALYTKRINLNGATPEDVHSRSWIRDTTSLSGGSKSVDHQFKVVQGPRELLITEGCIVLFGIVVLIVFFCTEKLNPNPWMRQSTTVGKALDSRNFLDVEEQTLQGFIQSSSKPFLIAVDGREKLTYARLHAFVTNREVNVSCFGVSGMDRLASLLGNGPETAVAFWVFSAQCAFAPINDKASREEIAFTLMDLPAKAVVMRQQDIQGRDSCAGVPILEYVPHPQIVGLFSLKGIGIDPVDVGGPEMETQMQPSRGSVALVIQTAGTTKKPKLVPLTHENLILSCSTIAKMIELHPDDRVLNVQPLFHIGGISNNIIAPVLAHSSVVCASHFTGHEAYDWIKKYRPTWFYGSPTNHILIMRGQEAPEGRVLRCIRSAASALLPSLAEDMVKFWGCEVLPAYGMTECTPIAGHQSGKVVHFASVGPTAAPETMLDERGEILIRGPSVFSGYEVRSHMEEDPNAQSFAGGWFHTGDRGETHESGYLSIVGRFKEMIVRGGENISPIEVENAMVDERLQEKVAFPVVHEELGEVVGLAVQTSVADEELGELLGTLKANAKLDARWMPEVIVKVANLPRGGAGKLKRVGLQQHLRLPPRSLARQEPMAYSFNGEELVELEVEEAPTSLVDSLGLMRGQGGRAVPQEDKNHIMATAAIVVFMAVCFDALLFLRLPSWSTIAPAFTYSLGGNIPGGMRWTMQCLMACASYLLCDEPFQVTRVICLALFYFGLQWAIAPLARWLSCLVSGEPPGSFYVLASKSWFVLVMLLAYVLFAGGRKLPFPSVQCFALVLLTICLCFWPDPFDMELTAGAYCWSACISIYFVVGHYGRDAWARVKAHPLSVSTRFQRRVKVASPFLFLSFLMITFLGPQAALALRHDASGRAWAWDPATLLLDELAGLVMMGVLSQAVRFIGSWLGVVGSSVLGIYMGCNLVYFCPHAFSRAPASFGIVIQKVWVLPTLQRVITTMGWCWPAQTLIVILYSCLQILIFGIPFHCLYAKCLNMLENAARKIDSATRTHENKEAKSSDSKT